MEYLQSFVSTEVARDLLQNWGIKVGQKLLEVPGRILPPGEELQALQIFYDHHAVLIRSAPAPFTPPPLHPLPHIMVPLLFSSPETVQKIQDSKRPLEMTRQFDLKLS